MEDVRGWQVTGGRWQVADAGANSPGVERPVPSAHVCRCRRPDSFYKSSDVLSSDESWESHGRKIAERNTMCAKIKYYYGCKILRIRYVGRQ